MALEASGNLSLGTNLFGATRCIKYEVDTAYGAYTLVEANTDTSEGLIMSDYYSYSHETIPAAPTGVTTTMSFVIRTNWTDASNNETGFRIQWSINSGAYGNTHTVGAGVVVATLPISCVNGSTYRARVQSYNGAGNSSYVVSSNQATGDGNCPS